MSYSTSHPQSLPLISIITVTLNAGRFIERCINSVSEQSYSRIEHIIIDGKSIDDTVEILKKHQDKIGYSKSEPDTGIYNAMNKALDHAKGDWIYFLGADDFLYPGFSEMITHLKNPNTIYNGHCLWGNIVLGQRFTPYKLTQECICHHSILYPKKVFQKYRYKEDYKVAADYFLNIQCWNDKEFIKEFRPLLIANFAQGGFSEQVTDHVFVENFDRIVREQSSTKVYLRYLYKLYKNKRKKAKIS